MTSLITPRPIVLCGPSGVGKNTLVNKLLKDFPNKFAFCISHTTRKPRMGEEDGVSYHFTTKDQMQADIKSGKFVESATFGQNLYGTSKAALDAVAKQGKICILDVDVQGVKQIKNTEINPYYIFIEPPSLPVLETRLRARKTESEESLAHRLEVAKEEIAYGKTPGNFHIVILNDDLEDAYRELNKFIVNAHSLEIFDNI